MVQVGNININDISYWHRKQSSYKTFSNASGLVKTGDGILTGIFVASGAFTFKLWDSTAATTTVLVNTTTAVTSTMTYFPNVRFDNGLYLTMTTTGELTVFYK